VVAAAPLLLLPPLQVEAAIILSADYSSSSYTS